MPVSTRPAGPSRIHSSPLVKWLSHWDGAPAALASTSLVQGLAPWLAWTDAIALSGALNTPDLGPVRPAPAKPAPAAPAAPAASARARQLHADLSQAIRDEPAFIDVQCDPASLGALRGHVRLHQRAMAARIPPLRAQLRQALTAQGPAGAQLASLDAVFEQALAARERQLLDTLPARLNQALAKAQARQDCDAMCAGRQAQAMLLAELAHRLQPVDGMLQALGHAPTGAA